MRKINNNNPDLISIIFVTLFIFGGLSELHFETNNRIIIPYALSGFCGLLLLVKNIPSIEKQFLYRLIILLASLAAILTLTWIRNDSVTIGERLRGNIQLIYSIILTLGFMLEAIKWPMRFWSKYSKNAIIIIIIGLILEIFTPLKNISDSVREIIYVKLYDNDSRDIILTGGIRPKLFLREPAHIAIALVFFCYLWSSSKLLLTKSNYFILLLILGVGLYTIQSPFILLIIILAVISAFSKNQVMKKKIKPRHTLGILFLGLILILLVNIFFKERLQSIKDLKDGSSIVRFLAPPILTGKVLSEFPIIGVGIGGKELLENNLYEILVDEFDKRSFSLLEQDALVNQVTNCFWLHWIYFGLGGGLLMLYAIFGLLFRVIEDRPPLITTTLIILIFSQTIGGYVTIKFWMFLFFIIMIESKKQTLLNSLRIKSNIDYSHKGSLINPNMISEVAKKNTLT